MPCYPDLGPIDYFREYSFPGLRAVGWLGGAPLFERGEVTPEFFERLCSLLVDPWQPVELRGFHTCEFCPEEETEALTELPRIEVGDEVVKMGVANLFVPGEDCVYVAPSLIAHYIRAHRYSPPKEFVEAVLQCPETHSKEYVRARRTLPLKEFVDWMFQCREPRSPEYLEALSASGAKEFLEWTPYWLSLREWGRRP